MNAKWLILGKKFAALCILPLAAVSGCMSLNAPDRACRSKGAENMQVRIAELEILPEWLDAYLEAAGAVGAESVAKEPGVAMNIRSQRYSARACNGNVPREVREGRKDERRLSELGGLGVRQTCPVPSSFLTMKNTSES